MLFIVKQLFNSYPCLITSDFFFFLSKQLSMIKYNLIITSNIKISLTANSFLLTYLFLKILPILSQINRFFCLYFWQMEISFVVFIKFNQDRKMGSNLKETTIIGMEIKIHIIKFNFH